MLAERKRNTKREAIMIPAEVAMRQEKGRVACKPTRRNEEFFKAIDSVPRERTGRCDRTCAEDCKVLLACKGKGEDAAIIKEVALGAKNQCVNVHVHTYDGGSTVL